MEWLEKNKETNWFVVWTSETLGEGSTDLPEANAFAESDGMQAKCLELWAQKLERLAPFIEATGQKLYKVIADVEAYDKRVTTGAQTAIKWAERLKTAGSIAAGIASGGLGLTGSALVAGGYSFAQGAAEQMSAVHHGLQHRSSGAGSRRRPASRPSSRSPAARCSSASRRRGSRALRRSGRPSASGCRASRPRARRSSI